MRLCSTSCCPSAAIVCLYCKQCTTYCKEHVIKCALVNFHCKPVWEPGGSCLRGTTLTWVGWPSSSPSTVLLSHSFLKTHKVPSFACSQQQ